jgi:hypothetical protein
MILGRGLPEVTISANAPAVLHPSSKVRTNPLLDWPAEETARQMTLIEYELFRKIQPQVITGFNWLCVLTLC